MRGVHKKLKKDRGKLLAYFPLSFCQLVIASLAPHGSGLSKVPSDNLLFTCQFHQAVRYTACLSASVFHLGMECFGLSSCGRYSFVDINIIQIGAKINARF